MKTMKTLLCVLLSLVLALGMFAASAEALLDNSITLRNVVITLGDQEFALSQQAKLFTKADENGAALRFELINGENVLLPISGEIGADGVRFTLDDSGRVYSVDLPMLLEMSGLTEEDLAMLEMIFGYAQQAVAAMEALVDPANLEALEKANDAAYTAMLGPAAEVEMDINGKTYPGISHKGALTAGKAFDALEVYMNTGITEWDQLMKSILDLFAMSLGVEAASFADLKAVLLEMGLTEEDMNAEMGQMEMIEGGDEAIACLRAILEMVDEASGLDAAMNLEMIADAENIDFTMVMDMGEDTNVTATMGLGVDDEGNANVDVDMIFDFGYNYSYDDGYIDTMDTLAAVTIDAAQVDGLWESSVGFSFSSDESFGYEGDVYTYTSVMGLTADTTETIEADGSKTTATTVTAEMDGETFTFTASANERVEADGTVTTAGDLSLDADALGVAFGLAFEVDTGAVSGLSALVGENTTVYPLTEDDEDVAYTLISADAMGLMADVMELAADETIMSLVETISAMTASLGAYAYEDGLNEDQYYEETYLGEEAYEDVEYTVVNSFEEAAAIYPYEIPAYTAPEGFTLSYIEASEMDVYAEYLNADETDYIGLYITDFGMDLTEEAEIAYYDNGEGQLVGAEVIDGSSYVSFYFVVDSEEAADAIVAGLTM